MRPWALIVLPPLVAAPAAAQDKGARVSLGYALAQDVDGGRFPLGCYLALASAGRNVGAEVDVG